MADLRVQVRRKPDRELLQLYFVHPLTGRDVTRSAGTADESEAERAAALWERELESKGFGERTSWEGFRARFEDEFLLSKAPKTLSAYKSALNAAATVIPSTMWMEEINASTVSRMQAAWRTSELGETSIATYLRHIKTALKWAKEMGMIHNLPTIRIPSQGKRRFMRGRPLTEKEFKLMKDTAREVHGDRADSIIQLITGLWLSGLRLHEAVTLSWDSPPVRVDLDGGRFPRIVFHVRGQKARRDEIVPMTPDFAAYLKKTKRVDRHGPVFPVINPSNVGRDISEVGKVAKIVTEGHATATAHDLRRSFGTRWASRVKPITLKTLMRHVSIETTLKYYIDQDADDVAAELYSCTPACTPKRTKRA